MFTNRRALRRASKQTKMLYNLTDDESLQLEEEVLALMESKQEPDVESPF